MCEDARLDALVRDEEAVERQRVLDEEMARALFGEEAGGAMGPGTAITGGDLVGSGGAVGADAGGDGDGGEASGCCVSYGGHANTLCQDQDTKSNTSGSGSGSGKREKWTEVYSHGAKGGSGLAGEVSLLD